MASIKWDETYSVGNALLDAHHKIFFEMIAKFSECPILDDAHAMKLRTELLLDYVAMHFSTEEKLMRETNYPHYERHKAEHDGFRQTVLSMYMDSELSGFSENEALEILRDWGDRHVITGEDRLLADYLRNRQPPL